MAGLPASSETVGRRRYVGARRPCPRLAPRACVGRGM